MSLNNQKQIVIKQNEEKMLRCQYTARKYYNKAEKMRRISLAISTLSTMTLIIPNKYPNVNFLIPILVNALGTLFHCFARRSVEMASEIRNFFDAKVLNLHPEVYQESQTRKIWERVEKICSKNDEDFELQKNKTGHDMPPGVRDWYEFHKEYKDNEAVVECQRQNCSCTRKLSLYRLSISAFLISIFIVIAVLSFAITDTSLLICLGWLVSLNINLFGFIIDEIKYLNYLNKINTIVSLPDLDKNINQIEYLQDLICKQRKLLVLEINFLHKKTVKKWSEMNKQIVLNGEEDI